MPETHIYEAKCRRCGNLAEWYHSESDQFSIQEFNNIMTDYIKSPRLLGCIPCKKSTVQDVVAYGQIPIELPYAKTQEQSNEQK